VDRAFHARPLLLRPAGFVPLVALTFLAVNFWQLHDVVGNAKRLKNLTSEDSAHYIQIAGFFAQGDFSMSYVERRPHRQPLYPLLLAPAVKLGENNPFWLGAVNIWIGAFDGPCPVFWNSQTFLQPVDRGGDDRFVCHEQADR